MPPLGCWLACPVIWKLLLAYHNSAYKHAILCVAGCSSRGFRTRNRVTCIGIQGARNAKKNGSPEILILLLQPHSIVWAPAARLQACSFPRRQSAEPARITILLIRPHVLIKGEHYSDSFHGDHSQVPGQSCGGFSQGVSDPGESSAAQSGHQAGLDVCMHAMHV